MATFAGIVRKLGLEGGVWVLQGDDGEQYHLIDAPDALRKDGLRARVEGTLQGGASIAMVGRILRVRSFSAG